MTRTEAEGGAASWARPTLPVIDPKEDAISAQRVQSRCFGAHLTLNSISADRRRRYDR